MFKTLRWKIAISCFYYKPLWKLGRTFLKENERLAFKAYIISEFRKTH